MPTTWWWEWCLGLQILKWRWQEWGGGDATKSRIAEAVHIHMSWGHHVSCDIMTTGLKRRMHRTCYRKQRHAVCGHNVTQGELVFKKNVKLRKLYFPIWSTKEDPLRVSVASSLIRWSRNSPTSYSKKIFGEVKTNIPVQKMMRNQTQRILPIKILFRKRNPKVVTCHGCINNNVKTSAACPLCNHPDETVEHHLLDCINLKELPTNQNIHKCPYGSTTCSSFKLASGERTKAHMPLVR